MKSLLLLECDNSSQTLYLENFNVCIIY